MEERENKKLGTILNYAIIVCIAAILIMIICGIVGKFLDKKTNRIGEFSERHPRLNMVIALALLVYCGATRTQDFLNDTSDRDEEGERQIVSVSKMLGNELGMKVTHFTSNESAEEREVIKQCFATASPYQAIIAIKCLDEGVNIPSIKTAFILASTTNPKEYIQRRGRVLRLAKNKPYAVIYDFVTLTEPLEDVNP